MRKWLLFLLLNGVCLFSRSQITINNNSVASDLAQRLVGFGVQISNPVLNCPQIASGDFTVTSSNLGLDSGIVLTSGSAVNAAGPATGPSTSNNAGGDADLSVLCNQTTQDACILEFDFETIGDSIKFNYVFGSTEYPSFTCTVFNDVFGFFLSGPGIAGPYSNGAVNLALVPGSTTCPVGVSTIYCPNSPGCCNTTNFCFGNTPGCGAFNATNNTCSYFVCNAGGTTVNYQGFTTVLQASSQVIPCTTYHMKLAISDAVDHILDSGVFLESGSFSSNEINVKLNTGLSTSNGDQYIIEGCDTSILRVSRKLVLGTANTDTVHFIITGTAQNTIDYNTLQDTIIFSNNISDTIRLIQLYAYDDGISEGIEEIKIYVSSGCSQTITDSVIIQIRDSLDFTLLTGDQDICLGDTVHVIGQSDTGISITWAPATDVPIPNQVSNDISPGSVGSVLYTITGTYGSCDPTQKFLRITTDPVPVITPIPDFEICGGDKTTIHALVQPPFNYNVNWTYISGLNIADLYNPEFTGTQTQDIILDILSPNAGCSASDTFHVDVWPYAQGTIREDTLICNGEPAPLWATSTTNQFLWYPDNNLSCNNCPDPVASSLLGTQTYSVVLVEDHGCNDTLSVTIETHPPFSLQLFNQDTTIYLGDFVKLFAGGAPFYTWTPGIYLDDPHAPNPISTPLDSITYIVRGLSELKGCPQYDTVRIRVIVPNVIVPNAFSPNGDGNNDVFKIIARDYIHAQEFRIYNRWGQEVFYTRDITKGWDGTFKGIPQNSGTYYYLIRVAYPDGHADFIKGDLTLIR